MKKSSRKKTYKWINRYTAMFLIMFLVLGLLVRTLFDMQIVHGQEYRNRANDYSVKDISKPAPRGEILDKDGEVLAASIASYDVLYSETTDSYKKFYPTMKEFFALLDKNGTKMADEFPLKVEPDFQFEFPTTNEKTKRAMELRFKKDRNLDDWLLKEHYGKTIGKSNLKELTDEESKELDAMLLAITPKETFEYLIRYYDLQKILGLSEADEKALLKLDNSALAAKVFAKVVPKDLRRYLMVRDELKMRVYQTNKQVPLAKNIDKKSAFVFMQKANQLPGVQVQMVPVRIYPYGNLAPHILGYLSSIPESRRENYESRGYDINTDLIGTYGIEAAFEDELKGSKTVSTVKVDDQGRTMNELFQLEGYPGASVQLSIDKDLQYTAQMSLSYILNNLRTTFTEHEQGHSKNATRGAVVALNVKTGKVLAMASSPDFDPNVFVRPGALTKDLYKKYFDPDLEAFGKQLISSLPIPGKTVDDIFPKDADGVRQDYYDNYPKPFLNYATQGLSPMGSAFKPFAALAALEENATTPKEIYNDIGYYTRPELGNYYAQNNNKAVYGPINIAEALKYSSNVYFLEMGYRLAKNNGLNSIATTSWKLGLGADPKEGVHSTTGIEINENVYGNVFNFDSRKYLLSQYAYNDMVNVLKKGVDRNGKSFKPFDVSKKSSDSEKVKKLKEEMDQGLRNYWMTMKENEKKSDSDKFAAIDEILDYNLNAIMETLPEEERKGLPDSNFMAREVANLMIYDRDVELRSPINVMNASLGQGDAQLTILQMANALATMVNGGTRYRTSLVEQVVDASGQVIRKVEPEVMDRMNINKKNLEAIKEGMFRVNNEKGGTAFYRMQGFPISSGGKTGTAQFRADQDKNYFGRHQYGTYISFAPYEDPEIAIAVIGYDAIHGSYLVPVARAIMEEYFKDEIKAKSPDYVREFDYRLRPVMPVEASLLKLKKPTPETTTPAAPGYVPGKDMPPSMAAPVNLRPDGSPNYNSRVPLIAPPDIVPSTKVIPDQEEDPEGEGPAESTGGTKAAP